MMGLKIRLQRLANPSSFLLEAVVEGRPLRTECIRREERPQVVLDKGDEFVDAATQHCPLAAGDGQESRVVGLGEVVDVAAVVDQGTGGTDVIEELGDEGEPAGAWQTAHEDMLPRTRYLEPEAQRLEGVVLSHNSRERFDLVCRRER
jgi:hypothetical protein